MRNLLVYFITISCLTACGISFKTLSINQNTDSIPDTSDPVAKARLAMKDFTSSVIYEDKPFDEVWGMEKDKCKDFAITDQVVYSGKNAIELIWDKSAGGCPWVGFGIGWNGWSGKQLGDILPVGALEFAIKSANAETKEFMAVLQLEDYAGGQTTASATNRSYYERGELDTDWQMIRVPLSHFDFEMTEGDPYNIKQLIIELNGKGHLYLDEIKIVELDDPVIVDKKQTPVVTSKKTSPFKGFNAVDIYSGDLSSVWGLETNPCKEFKTNPMYAYNGVSALDLEWNKDGCEFIGFGVGWDNWLPKDLTGIMDEAAIRLAVKAPEDKTIYGLTFISLMEDYNGNFIAGNFKSKYFQDPPIKDDWQFIYLPLNEFEESKEFEFNNIKQMSFEFFGSSRILVGDIEIVPFEDHKADPLPYKLKVEEKLPHEIFSQGFGTNNNWGLIKDECRDAKIISEDGNQFISYSWNSGDEFPCNDIIWGFSWSSWNPVDFTNMPSNAYLEFDIRYTEMPEMKIGVMDYNFSSNEIDLNSNYSNGTSGSDWVQMRVPLKDLVSGDVAKDNIKQIVFIHNGKGKVDIDNIKLVKS